MMVSGDPVLTRQDFSYPDPKPPSDVGFLDALGPAFRTENIVGSTIAYEMSRPTAAEVYASPKVDVWQQIAGTEYEPYYENFVDAETQVEVDSIKGRIDRENADREVMREAGVSGMLAALTAGVVDLPTLVPGGVAGTFLRAGSGAARTAAVTAAAAGTEAAVVEGILQGQQETRTAAESAFAIGGSVVLGGMLGGVAGAALARSAEGREAFSVVSAAIDREVRAPSSLSAAAARQPEITDFALPSRSAETVKTLTPGGLSFTDRLAKSQSAVARKYGNEIGRAHV